MFLRTIESEIQHRISKGKAIILTGPRQVGKTTLLKKILRDSPYLFLNGDDPAIRRQLTGISTTQLARLIGNHRYVFIDEAQRIPEIGITMKLITDQFQEVQLFASGSSSFDIAHQINEPLTGRKWEFQLFPISWEEYEHSIGYLRAIQTLEERLIFGSYPDVLNHTGNEREILTTLADSYLYRDILSLSSIKRPDALEKLVRALAFQVGNKISYNELSQLAGIDVKTVIRYVDILCDGFVIFRLGGFSRNLRNELKTSQKIYFFDNGIRNTLIGNFAPLINRQDIGALWENFLMAERFKYHQYHRTFTNMYFWRTKQGQEVDLVEERDGQISGYEFKWSPKRTTKFPKSFRETYHAETQVIHRDNFGEFVMEGPNG
ncbi:ATP-binding protein [Pontibacter sp. G13]|uniref:ATP-binding protein n=1 Tax=Pontibacter sp. G13 TaxID=3074898 RepID=UPI00288BEA36|nr:ATP-binding protein [Pontibacter sp. G13]WNJ16433.1 ATP-binding protein [Pontibacter sp. G13]